MPPRPGGPLAGMKQRQRKHHARLHPALRRGGSVLALVFVPVGDGLVSALTSASGDSSAKPDHSPGSRPRRLGTRHRRPCRAPTGADSFLHCHQPRHCALPLRTGRNRSTREDGLRPCFTTDRAPEPAPGRRRPECPVSAGRGALRAVRCSTNLDERPDRPASRKAHRVRRCRARRRPSGQGHAELRRPRAPRRRPNGLAPIFTCAGGRSRCRGRGRSAWHVRRSGPIPFPGASCSLWWHLRPCALRDGLVVGHP